MADTAYRRRAQSCTADLTCTQIIHDPSLLWRDAQWQREFSFARLFQRNSVALAVAHLSLAVPLAVASSASWAQTDVTLDTVTVRSLGTLLWSAQWAPAAGSTSMHATLRRVSR